ncbi:serine protease [Microvirga ossetica]|uniref:serine protease n=1 Tax=Microvirga ossetica TaxID=1882682 RepID=UPI001F4546D7|nr:serine protease [Microvirga ossetica]
MSVWKSFWAEYDFPMQKVRVVKSVFATAITAALLTFPALAQTSRDRPYFHDAALDWKELDPYQRVRLQVYLTADGYWSGVPNQDFGNRLYDAMAKFQSDHGFPVAGILTDEQVGVLMKEAEPILRMWGLQEVQHPDRGVPIWVPMGLGLSQNRIREGYEFNDPLKRVFLAYKYLPDVGLQQVYDYLLKQAAAEGETVQYKVLRKDFFVVAVFKNGITRYMRYHEDRNGMLGFIFAWNEDGAKIYGDRIVTLVSSSLWAVANGSPFVTPPKIVQEAANPPTQRIQPPTHVPKEDKDGEGIKSGTGFFVTNTGFILTNNHVIKGCSNVAVGSDDYQPTPARIVGTDPTNDLALLQADIVPGTIAALRLNTRLGESVAVFGYPLSEVLASSGNFTQGSVTALAGLRDDTRHLQIQAPVQSGNSGGPLLDASGNVIGVVVAMMDAKRMLEVTDTLPQNINFAIKTSVAANFLESKGVQYAVASSNTNPMKPEDIAERAKKVSVMVVCK